MKMNINTKNVKRSIKTKQTADVQLQLDEILRVKGSEEEFKARVLMYNEKSNEMSLKVEKGPERGLDSSREGDAVRITLSEGFTEVGQIEDVTGDRVNIRLIHPRKDKDQRKKMLSKLVNGQIRYQRSKGVPAYAGLEVFSSIVKGDTENIIVTKKDEDGVAPQEQLEGVLPVFILSEEAKKIKEVLGDDYNVRIVERVPDAVIKMRALMTCVEVECIRGANGDVEVVIREAPRIRTYVNNFARNIKRSVRDTTNINLGITKTISPKFISIKDDKPSEVDFDILSSDLKKELFTVDADARIRPVRAKVEYEDGSYFEGNIIDETSYDNQNGELRFVMDRGVRPGEPNKAEPKLRNPKNGSVSIAIVEEKLI